MMKNIPRTTGIAIQLFELIDEEFELYYYV